MTILLINGEEVRRLLPMAECIDVMEDALRALAQEDAAQPLRTVTWLPDRSALLGLMPGYVGGDISCLGVKAITVMMGDHAGESHQGTVTIFDPASGGPLAIVDASAITAIRTAAVSGLATRLLARPEATTLAIFGSGVQARSHLAAMRVVRSLRQIRVWSRTAAHARAFAEWASAEHGAVVDVVPTAEAAVTGAGLVCTVTAAREPILRGEWLAPGTHINAVGSSVPFTRELDTAAVVRSRLFVDRRESTVNEAGDFLFPRDEGAIDESHILGELGDLLLDRSAGRESKHEITLFKSLGLAVEDVAAAHYVYQKATAAGVGTQVTL